METYVQISYNCIVFKLPYIRKDGPVQSFSHIMNSTIYFNIELKNLFIYMARHWILNYTT